MMSVVKSPKVDGRLAWKTWIRLGSWEEARMDKDLLHPVTEKPRAKFTIIASARSWLFDTSHPENYAEGRKDWNEACLRVGVTPTDELWLSHAKRWAGNAFYYRPSTYAEVVKFFNLDSSEDVDRLIVKKNKVKELNALIKEIHRLATLPADGSDLQDGELDDPMSILLKIAEMTK